jgi:hypothetical protein
MELICTICNFSRQIVVVSQGQPTAATQYFSLDASLAWLTSEPLLTDEELVLTKLRLKPTRDKTAA